MINYQSFEYVEGRRAYFDGESSEAPMNYTFEERVNYEQGWIDAQREERRNS